MSEWLEIWNVFPFDVLCQSVSVKIFLPDSRQMLIFLLFLYILLYRGAGRVKKCVYYIFFIIDLIKNVEIPMHFNSHRIFAL